MSDSVIRHLVTVIAVLILAVVYFAGFVSGTIGWWWTFLGVLVLYPIIFKLVDV
ncbi:MAG: hypothetical protein WCW16_00425 [Candidatus Magasanikbacteria bacterium]|jgi:hypothetical protein